MRPKVLTMQAFGPYGGKQVIDFTLLEDINMFLIHGPTGSGKTTILDAICYALYGQTNGGERTAESMRSKFATSDEPAEVTLTFSLKGEEYKVVRSPKFERPKKRGEGFTVQDAKAVLYKLEDHEFKTIAARLQEVDRKIEELLVFNVDQFRQVIMIAQNKFRELLTAESKERQKILQDIFETGIYQNVEKYLEEKTNELTEEIKEKSKAYEIFLDRLKDEQDDRLTSYLTTKVLNNTPDVSQILEMLIQEYGQKEQKNQVTIEHLKNKVEQAQNVLIEQNEKYTAYQQFEAIQIKLKQCMEEEEKYRQLDKEIGILQKIQPILVLENQSHKLAEEEKQIAKDIQYFHKEKEKQEEKLSTLLKKQEAIKEENERIEQNKILYANLESYLPKMDSLSELISKQNEYEHYKNTLEDEKNQLEKDIQQHELDIKQAEDKVKGKDVLTQSIQEGKIAIQAIEYLLECREEKERKQKDINHLRNQYKGLAQTLEKLKKEEIQLKIQYDQVTLAWMEGQASIMATHLEEGKPCPVCGSTHHPQKARENYKLINPDSVKELETQRNAYIAEISKKEEEQNSVLIQGKSLNQDIEVLEQRIKSYADKINQPQEVITLAYKLEIAQAIQKYEKDLQEIEKLALQLETKKQNLTLEVTKLEKIKEQIHTYQMQLEVHKSKIEAIKNDLPEGIKTRQALSDTMKRIEDEQNAFEAYKKDLEAQLEKVKVQGSQTIGMLQEKENLLSLTQEKVLHAKENFERALKEAHIQKLQDYEDFKSRMTELESLQLEVKHYYTQKAILEENYKGLKSKVENFKIEALVEAKQHLEQLVQEKEQLQLEKVDLQRHITTYKEVKEGIEKLYTDSKDVAKKQYIISHMSQVAKGKNSKGLSFERYIQSSIFDEVLESANQKLRPMTTSRYELYRTDDLKRRNSQAGLDIAVIDHYVGQTRPISTLSGGESFMAALALALGLADVISRLAGASSLDTMFIDEGFGTLDEQSLELAIKTLLNLQDTGRLVGIISHVKELREQIPARLEITRTDKGSLAQFKL